jgi:SAM-dependent methyltransferase
MEVGAMSDLHGYNAATYGDRIAARYDAIYGDAFDVAATVDLLADLAGDGPVLELGIGTGRLALPLAARGIAVEGVDASEAMVGKLQAKPGGDRIPVTIGDFADVPVAGRYSLVFVAFNTFFALATQEEQVRCMASVADHLAEEGRFLIEAFVPDPCRYRRGQGLTVERVAVHGVTLAAHRHDPVAQMVESQRVEIGEDGVRLFPVRIRYAWPAELDLMARLTGLRLEDRWGSWTRAPFTAASTMHVSVYRRESRTG